MHDAHCRARARDPMPGRLPGKRLETSLAAADRIVSVRVRPHGAGRRRRSNFPQIGRSAVPMLTVSDDACWGLFLEAASTHSACSKCHQRDWCGGALPPAWTECVSSVVPCVKRRLVHEHSLARFRVAHTRPSRIAMRLGCPSMRGIRMSGWQLKYHHLSPTTVPGFRMNTTMAHRFRWLVCVLRIRRCHCLC